MPISLPPPPNQAQQNTRVWKDWFTKLQATLASTAGISWDLVDKAGSALSDLVTRPHSALQNVQGTGGYHLSSTEQAAVTAAVSGDGIGSVTSVNVSGGTTGFTVSGGPVTTSGTITLALNGTQYVSQQAQTTKASAATLTIAELLTGIVQYTGAAATLTLPTGTNIDAGIIASLPINHAFDFVVINTGSGACTIGTNTGLTTVGAMSVPTATSSRFRVRKTASNTFTIYQI